MIVFIFKSIYDLIGITENKPAVSRPETEHFNKSEDNASHDSAPEKTGGDALPTEDPAFRTDQIFQKMDIDKNGVISEFEFIMGCLQDKFLYQLLTADYSDNF